MSLCDRCSADCRHEVRPNEIVVQCGAYRPPMTRRDKLNAMDNLELAGFMLRIGFCSENGGDFCTSRPECEELMEQDELVPEESCVACLAEWLGREGDLP